MTLIKTCAVLLAAMLACSHASAQGTTRIRGVITAVDGSVLAVKLRDGTDVRVHLPPDATVATAKAIALADLPPNAYVGVTTVERGGAIIALEVHTIPAQAAPGVTSSDLRDGASMNNAHVAGVAKGSYGNDLTLRFKDRTLKVHVPEGTPVVTTVPSDRSALKPGEYIFAVARREADGRLVAPRIQASKDGVRPPQ